MNFRQKLFYTVLGGVLVFIGTLANNLTFSHDENLRDRKFDVLRCRALVVSGSSSQITLNAFDSNALINLQSGKQQIVLMCDDGGRKTCFMSLNGGSDRINNIEFDAIESDDKQSGDSPYPQALIGIDENGIGRFTSRGKHDLPVWESPVE